MQTGAREAGPNVVIVSLDTLRADRLEPYGYERPTSAVLSRLAADSVVFRHARAQAPQTAPSHASLFTSEYPGAHGIVNVHGAQPEVRTLPPGVTTLAELLNENEIETAAFVSGGNLTDRMEMGRGFDEWSEENEDFEDRLGDALTWLESPDRGRFMLFVHTYQVHAPYIPPPDLYPQFVDVDYRGALRDRLVRYLTLSHEEQWKGGVGADYWAGMIDYDDDDVQFLSDLYDAEVAYLDAALQPLVDAVRAGPRDRDTILVLLSDHGEEFKDHGKYQHDQVFEELLRVPLIISLPAGRREQGWRGEVGEMVDLIDVAPTVAELMGVDWSGLGWEGRSLVPYLDPSRQAPASWASLPSFSELIVEPGPQFYRTVTWGGWKLIHRWQRNIDRHWNWLFDVSADPGERHNLYESTGAEAVRMRKQLETLLEEQSVRLATKSGRLGPAGTGQMDEGHRALLIELGYLESDG